MGLIYLVRKKRFSTVEGFKELYYAVQKKLQKRGGKNENDLADMLSSQSGGVKVMY